MSTVVYILIAVLVFGVLIAVHELGHFIAAKACGVRVNEFSVGMGPAICKKQKGETLYALRCLPFGGFCAMEGEDEASSDPRALENKGFWAKLLIFAAGAGMNFLAGLLIILCLNSGVKTMVQPVIGSFADGCPLQETLQVGDRIAAIDGEKIYVYSDLSLLLNLNQTGQYDLTVVRDGKKVELSGVSMERREYTDQNGKAYTGYGLNFTVKETTLGDRLQMSFANAADFVRMVRLSLQMLVTGQAGVKDISGPVGIVTVITDVGQNSGSTAAAVRNIAYLAAMIAVNLAVMNLLPLPALDGGKIFFLVINALCMLLVHKRIPQKFESYVQGSIRGLGSVGIGQGIADGQLHVRRAQLGQHGPIPELHQGMHNALAVDHRLHLRKRQPVKPHGFDDLQTLIHQGSGVDGDFCAHGPVGVAQGVSRRHMLQLHKALAEKRPSGAGEQQALNFASVPAALKALKYSRMLRVHRHDLRAAALRLGHHQLPGAHQGLLIGQGNALFLSDGRESRLQTHAAHHRRDHGVGIRQLRRCQQALHAAHDLDGQVLQPLPQLPGRRLLIHGSKARAKLPCLLLQ